MIAYFRISGLSVMALCVCAGCAGLSLSADAGSGLNAREQHALAESFYWSSKQPPPHYDSVRLDALLRRSADPTLDGDRAERQTAAVALALTAAGDEAFAASLAHQSEPVRRAVAHSGLADLWTRYGLLYPRTQSLLQPYA